MCTFYTVLCSWDFNSKCFFASWAERINVFLISCIICFLYAISDEIHQNFIPGRSGGVKDILIDIFGPITDIGICGNQSCCIGQLFS